MLKFDAVHLHIEEHKVVFLQDGDGTIYKCTNTDSSIMNERLLIWHGSSFKKWLRFEYLKYKFSLVEDQGAAQAMWELMYD